MPRPGGKRHRSTKKRFHARPNPEWEVLEERLGSMGVDFHKLAEIIGGK